MAISLLKRLLKKAQEPRGSMLRVAYPVVHRVTTTIATCVNTIISTTISAPYRAYGRGGQVHERAQLILDMPDGQTPFPEWLRRLLWDVLLEGNGYSVWMDGNLYPVPAQFVTAFTDDWGRVIGYEVNLRTGKRVLMEREVVHIPFWYPSDVPGMGAPPRRILQDLMRADNAVWGYIAATLENFGAPSLLYSYTGEKPIDRDSLQYLEEKLREGFRGDRRGGIAVVGFPLDVQAIGQMPEGSFDSFLYAIEAAISSIYRVPAQVAGLSIGYRYSTYSNYESALLNFLHNTIQPLHATIEWQLYKVLRWVFEDLEDIKADISVYPILQQHRLSQANTLAQLYAVGIITDTEAREMLGFPEAQASQSSVVELPEEKDISDLLYWKEWDNLWQRYSVRLLKEIRSVLGYYENVIVSFVQRKGVTVDNGDLVCKARGEMWTLNGILSNFKEEFTSRLVEVAGRYLQEVAQRAVRAARKLIRIVPQDVLERAMTRASEEVMNKASWSTEKISRDIASLVWQNWGRGDVATLAHEIRTYFGDISAHRARTIARTVATASISRGQTEVWRGLGEANGVRIKRVWISMRDDRVRDSHREMDGKWEDEDGLFTLPSGLRGEGPGLFDDPAESINCRCTTRPRRVT